jgi:protein gp37
MQDTAIDWCEKSWNPCTGCKRLCRDAKGNIYCYAYYIATNRLRGRFGYPEDEPFRPTIHLDKLLEPCELKKPSKIFTCSMGDLFDSEAQNVWRGVVFEVMQWCPQHDFLVLTKQLKNLESFFFKNRLARVPDNLWIGITQDGLTTNVDDIDHFRNLVVFRHKFISFEPLLGPIEANLAGIDWVIIGAQTGKGATPTERDWVLNIINEARRCGIPVFIKHNLQWPKKTQEFPKTMNTELSKPKQSTQELLV